MNIGSFTLIAIIVIEMIFTGYCLTTKYNHKKLKGIIRISVFALFLICLIISIVKWSFRWYLFGGLLLIQAIIGVFSVLKKTQDVTRFRPARIIRNFIITALLFVLCLSPLLLFPQYSAFHTTGPYNVAAVSYTYVDKNRNEFYAKNDVKRKLNVEFWYPDDPKSQKIHFLWLFFRMEQWGLSQATLLFTRSWPATVMLFALSIIPINAFIQEIKTVR